MASLTKEPILQTDIDWEAAAEKKAKNGDRKLEAKAVDDEGEEYEEVIPKIQFTINEQLIVDYHSSAPQQILTPTIIVEESGDGFNKGDIEILL